MELSRQDRAAARHNPAPIKIGESNGITVSVLGPGETLPAILTPHEVVKPITWAEENKDFLIQTLRRHGAILFRGLDVTSVSEFEAFASKLCPTLFGEYNDLPHEAGKVYGTTPYPQDKTILFHNESSHMHRWPMKQFFYCIQPSLTGGRTPILDCREALRALDPKIVSDFETKGLLYIRNFAEGIDVPWQEFFHTKDKAEVEKFCKSAGMDLEWKRGNGLRVTQRCPGIVRHPHTGERIFFNQVQLHHPACLDPKVRSSLLKIFKPADLPRNVTYGDGSVISDETMDAIDNVFWTITKTFDWQSRDVVMVDNMLVSHARLPYTGPRKICVAMGEIFHAKDLTTLN